MVVIKNTGAKIRGTLTICEALHPFASVTYTVIFVWGVVILTGLGTFPGKTAGIW